jgi:hypothetical protein
MLKIDIKNLPYMPLNRAKMLARNMLIKTPLCREFEKDLSDRLRWNYTEEFNKFFQEFDKGSYYLEVCYQLYCPKEEFFTKAGDISSRCPDADSIKVLQDGIFKSIGIDDKHIKDLRVLVLPSEDGFWNYTIIINKVPLSALYV